MSGWLVGLPFTSAPIAFFLARDEGLGFAATAAAGTMAGAASQAGFCVAYAWAARRARWPMALLAGCAAFALCTVMLDAAPDVALPAQAAVAFAVLLAALWLVPRVERTEMATAPLPRWDLPVRMALATVFVLALTAVAAALGPRLTGLLAPFPLYAAILTVFAHAILGPVAAVDVLRGLLVGLFAFAAFFLVLAATLEGAGMLAAFSAALLTALAVQVASLWALTRSRRVSGAGPSTTGRSPRPW
ncbi:MAG TPA: hypothetical protein VGR82_09925 [Methylomirabilota bacterium]|nr:hypothetical protein [Methylomirabilota bacterium]